MWSLVCIGCLVGAVGLAVASPEEDLLALYGAPGEITDPALLALGEAIPGVPGEDYPIYSTPPETSFTCDDGKIEGYYADPEAECQSFHICANDGNGGLLRYPFLCPNGTVFNQNYFICDWWFNFDCSTAEDFYYRNEEVAAAAAAATAGGSGDGDLDLSLNARVGRRQKSIQSFGNDVQEAEVDRRAQISQLPLAIPEEPRQGNSLNFPESNIPVQLLGTPERPERQGRRQGQGLRLRKGRRQGRRPQGK